MQQIYIVHSIDEDQPFTNDCEKIKILKVFAKESDAHEFMAECGYQLEQWNKDNPGPHEIDFDDPDWRTNDLNHPFSFDDGHVSTGFTCTAYELN
jgi:hypothetical protein